MKSGIHISRVWSDDDIVELRILVSDGVSSFSNNAYVGHPALEDAVASLQIFKSQVHGGLLDVRFGEFGPEYASGSFHARFHVPAPGRVFVSCEQESEFVEFAKKEVASKATLYIKTEPALLDRFIAELRAVSAGASDEAYLEAV
ncbi:MAG: hypothetical protein IPH13_18020 [Planctomycetes bacterium]|nr:hypothetical protein [Planctomycetota bacterium]MCC7170442.1 hypothetical protein [Planctomycetota bacterium]